VTLTERARRIRLVLLDVDGVLTDGAILLGPKGTEHKRFHVRDGAAIVWAQRAGLLTGLLSGRRAGATSAARRSWRSRSSRRAGWTRPWPTSASSRPTSSTTSTWPTWATTCSTCRCCGASGSPPHLPTRRRGPPRRALDQHARRWTRRRARARRADPESPGTLGDGGRRVRPEGGAAVNDYAPLLGILVALLVGLAPARRGSGTSCATGAGSIDASCAIHRTSCRG